MMSLRHCPYRCLFDIGVGSTTTVGGVIVARGREYRSTTGGRVRGGQIFCQHRDNYVSCQFHRLSTYVPIAETHEQAARYAMRRPRVVYTHSSSTIPHSYDKIGLHLRKKGKPTPHPLRQKKKHENEKKGPVRTPHPHDEPTALSIYTT